MEPVPEDEALEMVINVHPNDFDSALTRASTMVTDEKTPGGLVPLDSREGSEKGAVPDSDAPTAGSEEKAPKAMSNKEIHLVFAA